MDIIVIIANYYSLEAGKGNFQCCTLYFMDPANGVQYLHINEENILFQTKKIPHVQFYFVRPYINPQWKLVQKNTMKNTASIQEQLLTSFKWNRAI